MGTVDRTGPAVRTFCKAWKSLLRTSEPLACKYASTGRTTGGTTLALPAEVAAFMVVNVRVLPQRRRSRGFSLIELMVVVIIIGVVAALAIPSMSIARFDRLAYNDAGAIMQLFRSARTRAIARGGAVLVTISANGAADRGTFRMYEAVSPNAGGNNQGLARTPVASCKAPTDWTVLPAIGSLLNGSAVLGLDGVNLNDTLETDADIQTQLFVYAFGSTLAGARTAQALGASVCWTPLGRSYVALGSRSATMFAGMVPTISPLELQVQHAKGGTYRSVVVPPNGMARMFSHTWP